MAFYASLATLADAPDRFVINLQPDQGAPSKAVLTEPGVMKYDWFPMIRGRLVAVKAQVVQPQDLGDERAARLVESAGS